MGSLFKQNKASKPKGVISEDMIHRIDMMNDEQDSEQQPYQAKRRSRLEDNQLFDDTVYDDQTEEFDASAAVVIIVVVIIVAVLAGLAFVLLK